MQKYAGKDDVIPFNFWDDHEPTKKLGTFCSSPTLPIDSVNYNILKQIVKDRPITPPPTYEQKRKAMAKRMKEVWADPQKRKAEERRMKEIWADPNSTHNSTECRENISRTITAKWKDIEYRVKMKIAIEESHSRPEYRKKMSESLKRGHRENPERGERIRELQIRRYSNPRERAKQSQRLHRHYAWKKVGAVFQILFPRVS